MIRSQIYNNYWEGHNFKTLPDFSFKWPAIRKFIPKTKEIKILDFGCGPGILINAMKKVNSKAKYTGIDVSDKAISQAKKRHPDSKFFTVADGQKLPLKDKSVDFIISTDVIEHVYNTKKAFEEFYRVLKPGGKILLTTPYHGLLKNIVIVFFAFEKIFDPFKNHIRFYTKKSLFHAFTKHNFKIEKHGYFGRFYPFSRAMFVLARKA